MARVKVVLHGYLRDLYDEPVYIDGDSVAEVINGFCKQTKCLDVPLGVNKHQIRAHGFDTEESLYAPLDQNLEELHLMPDMCGGKSGGFVKIVIGTVLIAAAFVIGGPAASVAMAKLSAGLMGAGIGLVLGGVMELLSPAPEMDTAPSTQDVEASRYLGASGNTVKIGTRIPLLYGRHEAYGHYLSFNVDAKDISL